ncbi:protein arginine kinase [Clostridium thailandense]|uniref:Protein-arginine kinase n=1 Tax=Clostridium thailandense TaxID=2794346 RepID=A0A949TVU3_9CLOT|nr:protein arginine kinase [Clostridium thailandense]MBV7274481.1 protein arginine kinase [Clostridium thailandense]
MENWINSNGKLDDFVLSSRIRFARNIEKIPFPHKLNIEKAKQVIKLVEDAFYTSSHVGEKFTTNYLDDKDMISKQVFLERHLISKNLIDNSNKSAFILNSDETISIMINEEDHIRVQCITAGLNLEEAYDLSDKIDNLLEEKLDYAFDEKLGYITSCPTNIGTGLRASVMIHLPAISLSNKINGIINAVSQVGMTVRGLYGEGSKAVGDIYQISNQITLGLSEEEIVGNLEAVVRQIMNEEIFLRQDLMKKYKDEIEDRIYRALGILKSAVLLNSNECLKLLSDVRLGVEMGIIKDVDKVTLNNLLVNTQPASIQQICRKKLSSKESELSRAKLVKERLVQVTTQ